MGRLSFKVKISLLCLFLLGLLGGVGGVGYRGTKSLVSRLQDIAKVQLPAVRSMSLADMMHDGLRAVAFRALFESKRNDPEAKREVRDELQEMSGNLRQYIASIEKLDVHAETKAAIQKALPEIEAYIQSANGIVELALSGKEDLAAEKIPDFQTAFSSLEERLEVLGGLIEKDSEESLKEGETLASSVEEWSLLLVIGGFSVGGLASLVIIWNLMRTLRRLVSGLLNNAEQVSQASTQIASSSEELSQSSVSQAASLEETASSLEQIGGIIEKASESAKLTLKPSAGGSALDGKGAVDQMLRSMEDISHSNEAIMEQINESNRQMSEIVHVIREISNKTKVINEIVFQTKLLSFNASVEAARAGEQGKGFAVVAEEVGNLARMSGQAAKEISDMLQGSMSKVEGIVQQTKSRVEGLVSEGKSRIDSGVSIARQCAEVLSEIDRNSSRLTGLARDISTAAEGVGEINKTMRQLDGLTQQNAATSEEAAGAAESLSEQARSLKTAVEELRRAILGGSSPVPAAVPKAVREENGLRSRAA